MKNIDRMSIAEREYHYVNLTNYCNLEHNLSSKEYNFEGELFGLYQEMLFKEYYKNSRSPYLSVSLFRAMLLLALKLKKFDWAEVLVTRYSKCVHPKHAANMEHYAAAMLAVEKHEHDAAMKYQKDVDLDYFVFKYDIHVLRLRVYYELGEVEHARCHVLACLEFLREDKFFKKQNKEYYRMFFKAYAKLLEPVRRADDIEYYLMKLNKEGRIACREWLMERYDDLIRSVTRKPRIVRMESNLIGMVQNP